MFTLYYSATGQKNNTCQAQVVLLSQIYQHRVTCVTKCNFFSLEFLQIRQKFIFPEYITIQFLILNPFSDHTYIFFQRRHIVYIFISFTPCFSFFFPSIYSSFTISPPSAASQLSLLSNLAPFSFD